MAPFTKRMTRSLKEPLRKVLGKAKLNFSELYTVLTDIECAMNQRPLTYIGSDPKNPQPITPAHLALGRGLRSVPDVPSCDGGNVTKRYRHLQNLLKHFWARWSKEYLPTLLKRKKWFTEMKLPKIGDVCLITEENCSRPSWRIGRITKTMKGKDGLVRTFKLKTAKGFVHRPAQRLHLLEEMK